MRLIEAYIFEAKCPTCGTSGAYHGITSIECPNKDCRHFDPNTDPDVNEPKTKLTTANSPIPITFTGKELSFIDDAIFSGARLGTLNGVEKSILINLSGLLDKVPGLKKDQNNIDERNRIMNDFLNKSNEDNLNALMGALIDYRNYSQYNFPNRITDTIKDIIEKVRQFQ